MKIVKDNIKTILAFILGILITSSSVYTLNQIASANVSYDNTSSKLNATNVKDAIDELNEKVPKVCEKKSGTSLAIGSEYECNPSLDGTTKYRFHVLRVEENTVKLIMQRNLLATK